MTIAYLIQRKNFRLKEAIMHVKARRPQVNPNNGTFTLILGADMSKVL